MECPECGSLKYVMVGSNTIIIAYECLNCGHQEEVEK